MSTSAPLVSTLTRAAVVSVDDVLEQQLLIAEMSGDRKVLHAQCALTLGTTVRVVPLRKMAEYRPERGHHFVRWVEPNSIWAAAHAAGQIEDCRQSRKFDNARDAIAFQLQTNEHIERQVQQAVVACGVEVPVMWLAGMSAYTINRYLRAANHPARFLAPDIALPVDPYYMGLWLGDGTAHTEQITTADPETLECLQRYAHSFGPDWHWTAVADCGKAKTYKLSHPEVEQHLPGPFEALAARQKFIQMMQSNETILAQHGVLDPVLCTELQDYSSWGVTSLQSLADGCGSSVAHIKSLHALYRSEGAAAVMKPVDQVHPLRFALFKLGLKDNKHIPDVYQAASRAQRLALLAGFLDADAHHPPSGQVYDVGQSIEHARLVDDLEHLCHGLGFFVVRNTRLSVCTNSLTEEGRLPRDTIRFTIKGLGLWEVPCVVPRRRILRDDALIKPFMHPELIIAVPSEFISFPTNKKAKVNVSNTRKKFVYTSDMDDRLIELLHQRGWSDWAGIAEEFDVSGQTRHNVRDRLKRLIKDGAVDDCILEDVQPPARLKRREARAVLV